MISRLLRELGVPIEWIDSHDSEIIRKAVGDSSGLFFVDDAAAAKDHEGRNIIVAQDFVSAQGVKSVFGAGEAYANGHEPRNGAWAIMHDALERLQLGTVVDAMTALGVGMGTKGPPIDLSAIAGANFETRVAAEVQLFQHFVAFEAVDHITSVNQNITVDGNIVAVSATAP